MLRLSIKPYSLIAEATIAEDCKKTSREKELPRMKAPARFALASMKIIFLDRFLMYARINII